MVARRVLLDRVAAFESVNEGGTIEVVQSNGVRTRAEVLEIGDEICHFDVIEARRACVGEHVSRRVGGHGARGSLAHRRAGPGDPRRRQAMLPALVLLSLLLLL